MELKDIIRSRMVALDISGEDLAKKIEVSPSTITRYLSGEIKNIRSDKINLLAEALNVTPAYLMGWNEISKAPTFGQRIHSLRGDLTVEELSAKSGISETELSNIESGYDPEAGRPVRISSEDLDKLAAALNIDRAELYQLAVKDSSDRISLLEAQQDFKDVVIVGDKAINFELKSVLLLPLYTQIACGSAMFVDDNVEEHINLPVSLLHQNKEYFCQYAKGDSMIDENIKEGDLLIFEKTPIIQNGQIGCFCVNDNMATCKKFFKDELSAIITLQPANKNYAPIIVTVETMNFHVVGKLVLTINKV